VSSESKHRRSCCVRYEYLQILSARDHHHGGGGKNDHDSNLHETLHTPLAYIDTFLCSLPPTDRISYAMMRRRPTTTAPSDKNQTTTGGDATMAHHQRESLMDEVDQAHHQRQSLMDEMDQDQMILELKAESDRLQQQMHRSFSILCVTAMLICLLVTLYLFLFPEAASITASGWMFRWLHTGLAALLHWEAQYIVTHPAHMYQPMFSWKLSVPIVSSIGLLLAVSLLRQQKQHASAGTDSSVNPDDSMLHWGLVLSNVATLAGAALLRLDSSSTANSLEELRSAKYRFKSL
jgi:hypothetical protein